MGYVGIVSISNLLKYVIISALLITVGSSPGTGNSVHPLHKSALWWRILYQHPHILPHSDRRDLGDIDNPAGGEVSLLINMNMTAIIMSTLLMSLMTVPSLSVQ